jgi:hypothetical protein
MPKPSTGTPFPKTLCVRSAATDANGNPILDVLGETPTRAEDGERVAVYELRDVKTKRVTHSLSDLRKPGHEADE